MNATKTFTKAANTDVAPNTATPAQIGEATTALQALLAAAAPQPEPAKASGKAAKAKVACRCASFTSQAGEHTGCASQTGRIFAPGHDAKLKGLLLRAALANVEVWDAEIEQSLPALMVAEKFGFGALVLEGVRKAAAKQAARLAPTQEDPPQEDPSANDDADQEDPSGNQEDPRPGSDVDETELTREELAGIVADEEELFDSLLAEAIAERATDGEEYDADGFPLPDADETDADSE